MCQDKNTCGHTTEALNRYLSDLADEINWMEDKGLNADAVWETYSAVLNILHFRANK